jgi:hypothetical protein
MALQGGGWQIETYKGNFGDNGLVARTGGNDIVLYTIPEPSAVAFCLLAAAGLLPRRRRGTGL